MRGYTLLELMVAMVVGIFLIAGISMSYVAIKQTVEASHDMSKAQEVLRFSSQLFTRSIKQTTLLPTVVAIPNSVEQGLEVKHESGALACDGNAISSVFTERYYLENEFLYCQITPASGVVMTPIRLLKGLALLKYQVASSGLVTITVRPNTLPEYFLKDASDSSISYDGVDIKIAATQFILKPASQNSAASSNTVVTN